MKRIATDILILIAISVCVAALMLLPPRMLRRIERNWGLVMFEDPVTFATADRLSKTLVKEYVFRGDELNYRLTKEDDTTTLALFFKGDMYKKIFHEDGPAPRPRDLLINSLKMLCYEVFPDERMEVIILDENLLTIDKLIAPTLFETQ